MQRIAFFGTYNSFDFFQIGGCESFVRRLAFQIITRGYNVDYILYGAEQKKVVDPYPGLQLKYYLKFEHALKALENKYEHILTIYIYPKNRIKFATFRKKYGDSSHFHLINFSWYDSLIKRILMFRGTKYAPYNGWLICISKRQYQYIKKIAKNAIYILPPVPEDYFIKPNEKPKNKDIKITFLGRIEPGKGIKEVIDIFKKLRNGDKFECVIYGIRIPEDKESYAIHNCLREQKYIKYVEVDRQRYSVQVEEMVKKVLKETDIFILPYEKLSSTIDTPLLLLEAMASLCVTITKPFGNIPDIYGESKFLVPQKKFTSLVIDLLKSISLIEIFKERERIYEQNMKLNFNSENIANIFLECLKSRTS